MRLAAVEGVTPVSLRSVEDTALELGTLMIAARGPEAVHDPGVAQAAQEAAELAHASGAGLLAAVTHPDADPAILTVVLTQATAPNGSTTAAALGQELRTARGPDIHDVTESHTERGYPVVIAERISARAPGCQLQATVIEPDGRRLAIFTLHSTTGRGWLELAAQLGKLIFTIDFRATVY
ncbi:hypothetical protein [Actinokineospora enzanensis]|uniref:hypothetical protein n=1 Tax=Actinokineospora enzanensis TaxID=155975 RepID=UPI00037C9A30|nr:hypothetical protein [Actinokineospora enzanensis]